MKYLNVFFLMFATLFAFGQSKIDFKEISKNVDDSSSDYYYERLMYKFVYIPNAMDSIEVKHLYYGQLDKKKTNDSIEATSSRFYDYVRNMRYSEAIPLGEQVLKSFPVNLEVLGLLVQCYVQADKDNPQLPLRGIQFRTLFNAILEQKVEKKNHITYTVMNVTDEYVVAGIQNINLYQYSRSTQHTDHGIYDHWKKGKNRISFLVVYNY